MVTVQTRAGEGIVVVGAGQAGVQLVDSLRTAGWTGAITLIGAERCLPYQRPPLSKDFMKEEGGEPLFLRAERFYSDAGVDLRAGVEVVSIDRAGKAVTCSDSSVIPYGTLVLATGARTRRLAIEGSDLAGVHELRTLDDAIRLQSALADARRVVVIGAGFIGLEFAAAARPRGIDVTVLEFADRPMARAVSPEMSAHFAAEHAAAGIDLRCGEGVVRLVGDAKVRAVVGSSGTEYPADLVLVGVGVLPNDDIAAEAGLPVDNGIVVGEDLCTADPAIYAIGDVARYPNPHARALSRLEAVQNATDQARFLARALVEQPRGRRYDALPWFWSQQGGWKLQIAGLAGPDDECIARSDDTSFSVYRFREGRLVAVESANNPGEHVAARRILSAAQSVDPDRVREPGFSLKQFAAAS